MDKLILERAQRAALGRDFGLAARLYKTLLKTDSSDIELLRALGSVYEKSGEDEKALPYYEQILTISPHDVDAMNSIGAIYRRLKEYQKSIDYLNRALSENKKTAMLNYTLGFTYKDMGNYDDAIDCFENVVSENPADVLAYNHLGVIYSIKKEYGKAVLAFQRGLQTDPNHPILRYNLGRAYEAEKNYDEAINCYELALKTKPGWVDAVHDLVNVFLVCNKVQKAYDIVKKNVQLHSNDANLNAMLGKVCLRRYDFDAAQNAFEKADLHKPDDAKILIGKAEACERKFKFEEAALAAKQAHTIGLTDIASRNRYVHIMISAGEFKRADNEIRNLLVESPSNTSVLDERAQYFICAGNEDAAEEVFKKIRLLNQNYFHHYLEAARRYCQIGKYDKAIEMANIYISNCPSNPAAFNLLGRIYALTKDYEESVNQFQKACSFNAVNVYAENEIKRITEILETGVDNSEPAPEFVPFDSSLDEIPSGMDDLPADENADLNSANEDNSSSEKSENERNADDDLLKGLTIDEGLNPFDEIARKTDSVLASEKVERVRDEMEFDPDEKSEPIVELEPEPEVEPEPEQPAPTIEDKLNDAVKQMENLAKLAEEKTQEAMKLAEEAAKKAEEAMGKNQPEEETEEAAAPDEPQFDDPMPMHMRMRQPANSGGDFDSMFGVEPTFPEPMFAEPMFGASSVQKPLPFGAAPQGLSAADLVTDYPSREAFTSAATFLPNIVKMIENKDASVKYRSELDLFQKLRTLSNSLPPLQKRDFLSSKTRLLMDYVIARMSGSPGLLTTVRNLLNSGILDTGDNFESIEKEAANITGDELVRKVVSDLKNLTAELEDQSLAQALRNEADKILEKL